MYRFYLVNIPGFQVEADSCLVVNNYYTVIHSCTSIVCLNQISTLYIQITQLLDFFIKTVLQFVLKCHINYLTCN